MILFCLVRCGRLSCLLVSFWAHRDIGLVVSYRIVSYVRSNCIVYRIGTVGAGSCICPHLYT